IMNNTKNIISLDEMKSFMTRALVSVGSDPQHAAQLAELLVTADYRGHFSHGLNRLDLYIYEIKSKIARSHGNPIILKESTATAWVDGNNLLGPVVGMFCMDLAINKAKQCGIGMVSVKGSNHFGIAGYYSMMALKHDLLGMSFTNATPIVVPTRAKHPSIGTNPISVAAPALNGDSYVLDMATTAVAKGKLEIQDRKGEPIPEGWAIDRNGQPLDKMDNFYALLPLGGSEKSSGYKGYGLSMMVELMCGVLSGGLYGPTIREHSTSMEPMNLSHCFIAINPAYFAPGFEGRLENLLDMCRNQEPVDGQLDVMVAGDPERQHIQLCDSLGGIPYHIKQVEFAFQIADSLGINRPLVIEK
ncbi:uncharacterized oxidoreductase YjmC-like, partial [Oppia nitens]|uniref:uncharacterized oxidoreductase YjmC-like n=1 Tax=Oppia nitens TaxID=1686743 RepID=UPI0023DCBF38